MTILLATGLAYTIAYFTATSRQNGDLEFADLEVNLLSQGATLTDAKFQSEYLYNLTPGDTVDFATITVKNTGDVDVYCLIKLDLEITKTDNTKTTITRWYNLNAQVVNSTNLPANTTPASHIAMNGSDTIDLTYTFNGNSYDNSYKGATVKVTLGAYAVQYANLPTDDTYTTRDLYATYLIIDTYGGDNIQLMSLTLNIDGTPTTYQAEAGSTLLEVASANNMADIEYTTCGFYTDSALTYGVDAESYMITEDVTLYSKTATPSSLTFRVNSTTDTTATTMATTMSTTYTNNATFSVSAASTSISGNIVIPKRYRSGNNDGYVTLIPSPITNLDTFTMDTSIGFSQIGNAFTLQLPNTITKIDIGAFMYSGIINIYIPNGLKTIEGGAFGGSYLTSINIPESVTLLNYVTLSDAVASSLGSVIKEFGVFILCENLTNVTFADNININAICPTTFYGCSSLASITLPDTVTSIGDLAFAYCELLRGMNIPSSVASIGDAAFDSCISITEITIPKNVKTIGLLAFNYCASLETVTFETGSQLESLTGFGECYSLKTITIPKSVKRLESEGEVFGQVVDYAGAFVASSLETVIFEEGSQLESIGNETFFNCNSLKEISIPNTVKTIGDEAFYDCEALREITIPSSVTSIGSRALYSCNILEAVYIPSSVETMGTEVFLNSNNVTIYTDVADATTATAKWGMRWNYGTVVYNTTLDEYLDIINA